VTCENDLPHSGSLYFADKDEVPGSSPGRPTTYSRRSQRCRQRAGSARCQSGPRWGRTPVPASTPTGPSRPAHPDVSLGDNHPPWSPPSPRRQPRGRCGHLAPQPAPVPSHRRPPGPRPVPVVTGARRTSLVPKATAWCGPDGRVRTDGGGHQRAGRWRGGHQRAGRQTAGRPDPGQRHRMGGHRMLDTDRRRGTPPSSWRLGALLSCVGCGGYEERAMGQRTVGRCEVRHVRAVLLGC
jgi:hypothetical protein